MDNYIVSARKYRPTTFDEVIGQDHIASTLKNALATDHIAHAYLFTGPRGVGKTTCARILAKVINCKNPIEKYSACNECDSCIAFNENSSFNIVEMDAASNNSVDQIRALIEKVRFQPQGGKFKVFIIDEVHMLSSSAFNAFLKTLEEPPPHVIFILATTEKHKIIPTILSRCQIFDFKRIQNIDIIKNLEFICKKENIDYDRDALHIIAEKADGAMRDALSIFDRVVSSVKGKIAYKDVISNLNLLDHDYFFKIVAAILAEDLSRVLLTFNEISRNGFEGDTFIWGLSDHLRELLVSKDEQTIQLLNTSTTLKNRFVDQSKLAKLDFILSALNIANQCDVNYPRAHNKQLHIELALSKMVFLGKKYIPVEDSDSKKKLEPKEEKPNKNIASKPIEKSVKDVVVSETINPVKTEKRKDSTKTVTENALKASKLNKLHAAVKEEIKSKQNNNKTFTTESVQTIVNEHINSITSPYILNILKEIKFELKEEKLEFYVPSRLSEGIIKQEVLLLEKLRSAAPANGFEIQVIVKSELFPNHKELKPKKILTNKEKFELFEKKNTLVQKIVDTFDLKIDAD